MIVVALMALSEIFLISFLISKGEVVFLQSVLFSQLWLIAVSIPFILRAEMRLPFFKQRAFQVIIWIGLIAVFAGIANKLQGRTFGSLFEAGRSLAGPLNDMLPAMGVVLASTALLASLLLRGEH